VPAGLSWCRASAGRCSTRCWRSEGLQDKETRGYCTARTSSTRCPQKPKAPRDGASEMFHAEGIHRQKNRVPVLKDKAAIARKRPRRNFEEARPFRMPKARGRLSTKISTRRRWQREARTACAHAQAAALPSKRRMLSGKRIREACTTFQLSF